MIRIDALWLCTKPVDMRCGAERLLAHVVHALGSASSHHDYMFSNARATRIKMLVHDCFGVWCAARRLNAGRFAWPREIDAARPIALTQAQFDALVIGLGQLSAFGCLTWLTPTQHNLSSSFVKVGRPVAYPHLMVLHHACKQGSLGFMVIPVVA